MLDFLNEFMKYYFIIIVTIHNKYNFRHVSGMSMWNVTESIFMHPLLFQ